MNDSTKKIDDYLARLPMWQRTNLVQFRQLIHEVAPDIEEDWKWNVPVFTYQGKMQFTMAAFKAHTKYNFIRNGALLDDPQTLFNNGLESKKSRSIDLGDGQTADWVALKALVSDSIKLYI